MYATAAILMSVLRNIGKQGKVTERTHYAQRLFNGQPVELMVKFVLERASISVTRIASLGNCELSNVLDAVEDTLAIGSPYHIAEQPTEKLDFLAQAGIFFVYGHGGLAP